MSVNNYNLASKPYTRGLGDNTVTVVEIRLSEGNRYSTNMREFEYNGETVKQLEDKAIQEGNIAVYKWKAPTSNNVDHI